MEGGFSHSLIPRELGSFKGIGAGSLQLKGADCMQSPSVISHPYLEISHDGVAGQLHLGGLSLRTR